MKKDELWYRKQIKGLYLIVEEGTNCKNPEIMISRKYIMEKLNMILQDGINFHPLVQKVLDKAEAQDKI